MVMRDAVSGIIVLGNVLIIVILRGVLLLVYRIQLYA